MLQESRDRCDECDADAACVVVNRNTGDRASVCPSCSTMVLNNDGGTLREYPLETYREHKGNHAESYTPPGGSDGNFDLFGSGVGDLCWMTARNDISAGSSVDLVANV